MSKPMSEHGEAAAQRIIEAIRRRIGPRWWSDHSPWLVEHIRTVCQEHEAAVCKELHEKLRPLMMPPTDDNGIYET